MPARPLVFSFAIGTILHAAACTEAPTELRSQGPRTVDAALYAIQDQFIVRLNDDVDDVSAMAADIASEQSGELLYIYDHVLKGFAIRLSSYSALLAIEQLPTVEYVEPDAIIVAAGEGSGIQTQSTTWGLDRIDQRQSTLDARYGYVWVHQQGKQRPCLRNRLGNPA